MLVRNHYGGNFATVNTHRNCYQSSHDITMHDGDDASS